MDGSLKFYHGKISQEKCRNILENEFMHDCRKGVFLLRDSSSTKYKFVLSVRNFDKVRNYPIVQHGKDACFSFVNGKPVHGIDEFIHSCFQNPENELDMNFESYAFVEGRYPLLKYFKYGVTTSLHLAVMNHSLDKVKEMLSETYIDMNDSIDEKNEEGQTALHIACSDKKIPMEIPNFLISRNASLFLRDASGKIPLFYAIENGFIDIVRLMIEKSRDVIQVKDSETLDVPLHVAARLGNLEIVKLLVANNASQHPVNKEGKFPIEIAADNKRVEVVKFLETRRPKSVKSAFSHGRLSRKDAEVLLLEKRKQMKDQNTDNAIINGTFLLRYSEKIMKNVISMLVENEVKNFEILKTNDKYHFINGAWHGSIDELIIHHQQFSDGLPIKLTVPLLPETSRSSNDYSKILPRLESDYEEINPIEGDNYDYLKKSTPVAEDPDCDELFLNENYLEISDDLLGEGNFGTVNIGILTIPGRTVRVAVKTLIGGGDCDFNSAFCAFLREAATMMNFNNPFIVKMVGIVKGPPMKIVQELQGLGSLESYLKKTREEKQKLSSQDVNLWAAQIADGMSYLESKRFVHRDLAARNILLAKKTHARISDFGLSRTISIENGKCNVLDNEKLPIRWYAPECFSGIYTHASDVWSFAVTVWEIYSKGAIPYQGMPIDQVRICLANGTKHLKPKKCPPEIYEMLVQCWNIESGLRPKFDQLRSFFESYAPIYSNVEILVKSELNEKFKIYSS